MRSARLFPIGQGDFSIRNLSAERVWCLKVNYPAIS
jgi:hypothetical protein